ncbi:substrate-binding domain-containing protein [Saccharopolyspora erythraea]|uniref:substrate-binding domain-containing protein n=1 Tax=Saccharopolyspora erythraea TaxID=1836 RepID=UPI0002EA8988|nr:substrate-binding domain-containing protein [Saccharopolyspora erythraea]QRK87496.1 substrate-binding domain-containing protein [Saccharopolyspora erythraea]
MRSYPRAAAQSRGAPPAPRATARAFTTGRQDAARLAELAVDAVLDRLEAGRTEARKVTLAPRLIVRGTTAPPA